MELVDSQIHLFEPGTEELATRLKQVWMSPEEVVAEMDAAGVSRAYVVPLNAGANPASVAAAQKWPDRLRIMGIIGLDKPASRELMADWSSSGFLGARLTFPPYRKVSWLKDGTADWFWPVADRLALPIMIWAPLQTEEIGKLAHSYPNIRFIVDHMNLYVEDKGETVARAVENLLPLARHPNIAVKVSSLPAHSSEGYPFRDMHPYIEQVVSKFAAERIFWGTDLTRRACSYAEAITMFTKELPFLNETQLEQIMGRAALGYIGW